MIMIIVFVVALLLSGCMMYSMVLIRRNALKLKHLEAVCTYQITMDDVKETIEGLMNTEKKKNKNKKKKIEIEIEKKKNPKKD